MVGRKVGIAYIPVLHRGYLEYLESLACKGVETLYLISDEILASHEELAYIHRKDRIRALPHETMCVALRAATALHIESLTFPAIFSLHEEQTIIYAPREDINTYIMETYFGGHRIEYENVFLRWNKDNIGEDAEPQGEKIALSEFEKTVMGDVSREATKSADWWRQVGAAIIKDGVVIVRTHNEHMPEKELPNILGDTRSLFKKGEYIQYVTTAHAEISAIADAAKRGVSIKGATLFTTDFPCPYCARAIAKSGIEKIYYQKGYAVLGGDDFFKEMGIETVKVDILE